MPGQTDPRPRLPRLLSFNRNDDRLGRAQTRFALVGDVSTSDPQQGSPASDASGSYHPNRFAMTKRTDDYDEIVR
ncbi:MAG: hypothetical protein WBX30_26650, partial [Stellaceae bacterium]